MRMCALAALLLLAAFSTNALTQCSDVVLADFESPDYGLWTVTGDAFGPGPAQGALANQMPVSGYGGHGLVNSFFHGDTSTGTLTSPEFIINRRYINFLIGGGRHPGTTCINLLVDGKIARTKTGTDSERLGWASWNVADLDKARARLQIVDNETGGWGHICVDEITMGDSEKAPVIATGPVYRETYRPQYHFTSRANWLNDPNGLVYYQGEYHLFFQHNPFGTDWGNMTWGHAVSRDLVHWQQLEDAIKPDKLGTIFSGSAVIDWHNTTGFASKGKPPLVAMYTAAGDTSPESKGVPFTQCLAYSNDNGRTFTKYAGNPVLPHIIGGNRDPKLVWFDRAKLWTLALYLDGDKYGLFTSPDLKSWKQIQTVEMPGASECPDFFQIKIEGESAHKWVLTGANGHYLVGEYDGAQFKPDGPPLAADTGANYYAVQTYSDIPAKDGRRIQIAWMNGGKYPEMPFNQQMSFPCELQLRRCPEGLRLCRMPVREVRSLYAGERLHKQFEVKPDGLWFPQRPPNTGQMDISIEFEPGNATAFGIKLHGETIRYDAHDKTVTCLGKSTPIAPVNGVIKLRILLDSASIELFGNDGIVSMTSCFLPDPKNTDLSLFSEGASVHVNSFELHVLKSAWNMEPAE